MPWILIVSLVLHVVPAVFWAGTTFVLARGAVRPEASLGLRKAQLGAAAATILLGLALGAQAHRYAFGRMEMVLALGAVAALVAAAAQGAVGMPAARRLSAGEAQPALAGRLATVDRLSALLLALALICMVIARYV